MGNQIRIVVADDHQLVRSGIKLLLETQPNYEVVDEVGNADDAYKATLREKPDVLLLDLHMPGERPLDLIPKIVSRIPETAILVLTMQDDPSYVEQSLSAGARGYLLKEAADVDLINALNAIASGKRYLEPTLAAQLVEGKSMVDPSRSPADLTPREIEVLLFLVRGYTNKEIASELVISVRTVESHRAHIIQKTGFSTRAALVRFAEENDLLS